MSAPKIDKRDYEDLLTQIRELVPFYTPEWKATDESDPGVALLKIFSQMFAGVVSRLNQVPDKNFIYFLNMLGIKLLPAIPSRGPITFYLSKGTATPVLIPARTQVTAQGDEPIVFETEKNMLATPAKLIDAFSINKKEDSIFQAPPGFLQEEKPSPFADSLSANAEKGIASIFLTETKGLEKGNLLKINEDEEYAEICEVKDSKVILTDHLKGSYSAGTSVIKVDNFELFTGRNKQEHILYLGHQDLFNVKSAVKIELKFPINQADSFGNKDLVVWQYWGEKTKVIDGMDIKTQEWLVFDDTEEKNDKLILSKNNQDEIKEREINGIKSRWIRCIVLFQQIHKFEGIEIDTIKAAISLPEERTGNTKGIPADLLFNNDIPLDKECFFPFNHQPRPFDTFYMASQEAFSKKGSTITINLSLSFDQDKSNIDLTKKNIDLSWEYWNGNGWVKLVLERSTKNQILIDDPLYFNNDGFYSIITFICPNDIKQIAVNGQLNFWIRSRLVSGDYGKEELVEEITPVEGKEEPQWTFYLKPNFKAPRIGELKISYNLKNGLVEDTFLEQCLTFNNLEYRNRIDEILAGKLFTPFYTLKDEHQTLYLGFDAPPLLGPISLFLSIEEQEFNQIKTPKIEWEYFREQGGAGQWARLDVLDGTQSLTQSGGVEFVGPEDFSKTSIFGRNLYWIRAIDIEDRFQPIEKSMKTFIANNLEAIKNGRLSLHPRFIRIFKHMLGETTEQVTSSNIKNFLKESSFIQAFHPMFSVPGPVRETPPAPKIKGMFLNTVMAAQMESIKDEILGSSNGTISQSFHLTKSPVLDEEIYVNEFDVLSEGERRELKESHKFTIDEVKDEKGATTEFWIKWLPVDYIKDSTANDRHYEIDRTFGVIQFGDGVNGAVPPSGTDNIKANYRSGGGLKGNLNPSSITKLKTSIAYVDRVSNPEAATGGCDTETVEKAIERGPKTLKHRNRAVTLKDFENLALEASRSIAKAKCRPNTNDKGEFQTGWVTVFIVPKGNEDRPIPTAELKRQVQKYLSDRTANIVVPNHFIVTGPVYFEVSIDVEVMATSIDFVPTIELETITKLRDFLHPHSGGEKGTGWDFGSIPCFSDLYTLLGEIEGIDYVSKLTMTFIDTEGGETAEVTPDHPIDVKLPSYALITSGKHHVSVNWLGR